MAVDTHVLPAQGSQPNLDLDGVEKATPSTLTPADEKSSDLASESADSSTLPQPPPQPLGAVGVPWSLKLAALVCISLFTLGSNFTSSALPPLKSTIKNEIPGVNNARYGSIASTSQLINGVFPIFSGIVIDYYGASFGSLCASAFIAVGSIVTAIGATVGFFPCILFGQIIFGFGNTTIDTAQSKLYSHWARGTASGKGYLGFFLGFGIAIGRVYNLAGKLSSVPIAENTGKWYWTFWVGAIMCFATLCVNIVYVLIERQLPAQARIVTGRQWAKMSGHHQTEDGRSEKRAVVPLSKKHLTIISVSIAAIPASFWVVVISRMLQAGTVNAYQANLAEVVAVTRGSSRLTAGYTSSMSQIIPIVLTPVVGIFFDYFGHRMHCISAVAALWVLVFSLLAFSDVNPYCPVILSSLALSLNAIPFIASIPLLVQSQSSVGTAFGIVKAFNSAGSTVMDVSTGAIQDLTPKGKHQYDNVFYFLIAMKSLDVILGLMYDVLDKRYFGGVLRASEKERIERETHETEADRRSGLRVPKRGWTWAGIVCGVALITTSYVLYIVYAIGT
ncbi:hypothetical protein ACQY0O_000396 [Thecaphora frezii]